MNRKNFGQLITALRNEQFDPILGRAWTQKMLAEQTGLTERIIGDIERGQRVNLDAATLLALAKAFRLSTLERREFFAAVTEIEDVDTSANKRPAQEILEELLETLATIHMPAFIHDPFFDLIAMNSLYRTFHQLPQSTFRNGTAISLEHNYLGLAFGEKAFLKRSLPQLWRQYVLRNILQFRYMTLRYRHTTYFQALFRALYKELVFREIWAQCLYLADDVYSQIKINDYYHNYHGRISYAMTLTSTLTPYGYLYLSVLVPRDQYTDDVFAYLRRENKLHIDKINPWPNPVFLPSKQ